MITRFPNPEHFLERRFWTSRSADGLPDYFRIANCASIGSWKTVDSVFVGRYYEGLQHGLKAA